MANEIGEFLANVVRFKLTESSYDIFKNRLTIRPNIKFSIKNNNTGKSNNSTTLMFSNRFLPCEANIAKIAKLRNMIWVGSKNGTILFCKHLPPLAKYVSC